MEQGKHLAIRPNQIKTIVNFARERKVNSIHYVGHADQSLIESLVAIVEKEGLTLMDIHNRWGADSRFFWDEYESCGMEYPKTKEWMKGIVCYTEGGPSAPDLLIRDIEWDHPRQLALILALNKREHQNPPCFCLIGKAKEIKRASSHQWYEVNEVLFATTIAGAPSSK
jgi:hypothetical protein